MTALFSADPNWNDLLALGALVVVVSWLIVGGIYVGRRLTRLMGRDNGDAYSARDLASSYNSGHDAGYDNGYKDATRDAVSRRAEEAYDRGYADGALKDKVDGQHAKAVEEPTSMETTIVIPAVQVATETDIVGAEMAAKS